MIVITYFTTMFLLLNQDVALFKYDSLNQVENSIQFCVYEYTQTQSIDLTRFVYNSNMVINTFDNTIYISSDEFPESDIVLHLLENGSMRILDHSTTSSEEDGAERSARCQDRGIWSTQSELSATQNPIVRTVEKIWFFFCRLTLGQVLTFFGGIGFFILSIKYTIKCLRERRIKVFIVGEPSSGKTAVGMRLTDTHVSEEDIRMLSASPHTESRIKRKPVLRGKLALFFKLDSYAGAKYGSMMNSLFFKSWRKAIVIVLSPSKKTSGKVDHKYVHVQLGFVKALIVGILQSAPIKPRMVLVFINKEDLIQDYDPLKLFAEHIANIKTAANLANVKSEVLLGSALKNKGIEQIVERIAYNLYPMSRRS